MNKQAREAQGLSLFRLPCLACCLPRARPPTRTHKGRAASGGEDRDAVINVALGSDVDLLDPHHVPHRRRIRRDRQRL